MGRLNGSNLRSLTLCFYNHNRNLETSDLLSSQLANSCCTHENQNLSELNPVICHFIAHQFQFSIFGNLISGMVVLIPRSWEKCCVCSTFPLKLSIGDRKFIGCPQWAIRSPGQTRRPRQWSAQIISTKLCTKIGRQGESDNEKNVWRTL